MLKSSSRSVFLPLAICASVVLAGLIGPATAGQDLQSQKPKFDATLPIVTTPVFNSPPSYLKSLRKSTDAEIEQSGRSRYLVNKSFGREEIKPLETIDHSPANQPALPSEFFGQTNGLTPTFNMPAVANGASSARVAHTNFAFAALGPREAPLQAGVVRGRTVDLEKLYGRNRFEINDPRLKLLELQQISKSRFEPPGSTPVEAY